MNDEQRSTGENLARVARRMIFEQALIHDKHMKQKTASLSEDELAIFL